ncbi:MAG TPA: cupredoxin domain-containing protein [Rhodocyclaceae bacterium]|nr:cupredoxin domain-containing protein [Rhodocyclaceae bacterium]
MKPFSILAAALLALTSGAQAQEDYVRNAKEHVDKADWKTMETITINITEHEYAPRDLVLKTGKAYKLELKNPGEKDHYYTAPEFFKAVAWRKVMVNKQGEIKAPYFTAIEILKKGGQVDLYFVPVNKGKFTVYCTIDDHREKGMEGSIAVE